MLPVTSWDLALTVGVTIATLGTSRLIASRSSTVSVLVPLCTPPTFCAPALTKRRFVPILSIWACTEACAPCPMLTIAITADTPMMMPSIVRMARILLRRRARNATRMIIARFIFSPEQTLSADFADYTEELDPAEMRLSETPLQPQQTAVRSTLCVICEICGYLVFIVVLDHGR